MNVTVSISYGILIVECFRLSKLSHSIYVSLWYKKLYSYTYLNCYLCFFLQPLLSLPQPLRPP